jgi:signal transduction histidine kinase
MGIDLITVVLEETSALLTSCPVAIRDSLLNHVGSIEENLQNMRNVNAFMLMNINRCMDYTKATNGLKLVPHIETASLKETIALPLHVMNAMQDGKTRIELLRVPTEICSHIITDKQWLQENIMCLLSNAVKYSHKGVATISVSLVVREISSEFHMTSSFSLNTAAVSLKPQPLLDISFSSKQNSPKSFMALSVSKIYEVNTLSPRQSQVGAQREIRSTRDIVYLRIEVEDEGIGLSDETRQTLFRF